MLQFLKHISQLILFPARGWEDISEAGRDPSELCRSGLYPLLGLLAASNFIQLAYHRLTLSQTLEHAVVDFGVYFAAYFLSTLIMEQTIQPLLTGEANRRKIETVSVYAMGLLAIISIIPNLLPASLTLLHLLPIFVALILYKSYRFLTVRHDDDVKFLLLVALAWVAVPMLLRYVITLMI